MGRDTWRYRAEEVERAQKKELHPMWRAVGCFVIVLLALGGYLFASWFLVQNEINGWLPIPSEVIRLPFAPWLPEGLIFKLVTTFLFMIIGYGILSIFYSIFFPLERGEYDSPPLRRRGGRRRR